MSTCRILVNDLDNCTTGTGKYMKGANHLLSAILVDHAKNGGYEGFYACTHRCYVEKQLMADHHEEREKIKKFLDLAKFANVKIPEIYQFVDLSVFYPEDVFTSKIVENFANATQLQCFAVSTPDDAKSACGLGYENILKLYELAVMATKKVVQEKKEFRNRATILESTSFDFEQTLEFKQPCVKAIDHNNKNDQLIQIAKDAAKRFAGRKIVLDYVDDKKSILENALKIKPSDLPPNVVLNVYHHDLYDQTEVVLCGTLEHGKETISVHTETESKTPANYTAPVKLFKPEQNAVISEPVKSLCESEEFDVEKIVESVLSELKAADKTPNYQEFKCKLIVYLRDLNQELKDIDKLANLKEILQENIEINQERLVYKNSLRKLDVALREALESKTTTELAWR